MTYLIINMCVCVYLFKAQSFEDVDQSCCTVKPQMRLNCIPAKVVNMLREVTNKLILG